MNHRVLMRSDIERCPIKSLDPNHYRLDGTCTCSARGVHRYLDASTAHLTHAEMTTINRAPLPTIEHECGAWVSVQRNDVDEVDERFAEDGGFPNLHLVVLRARTLGCDWINFDADADKLDGLPTYEW